MSMIIDIPRYRCHKEVGALRIRHVIPNPRGIELHFTDARFVPMQVGGDWGVRHKPEPGGYFVAYDDGYTSYSPADAFESGYAPIDAVSPHADPLEQLFFEFSQRSSRSGQSRRSFKAVVGEYIAAFECAKPAP